MSLTEKAVEFAWNKLKHAAESAAEDKAKEGAKSLLSEAIKRIQPTNRERVAKSLLQTFAKLLQDQFEDRALLAAELPEFEEATQTFLAHDLVQEWLAEPLDSKIDSLNHQRLSEIWNDLQLIPLPKDFEWDIVARRYLTQVRRVIDKDPELRALADHETFTQMRKALERLAPRDPGFSLERYRSRIESRYGFLKFDAFHVTGSDLERRVQLSKVFVAQTVKEDLPPLELPKEHIRQLEVAGEISAAEAKELTGEASLEQYRRRYREAPAQNVVDLLHDTACRYAVIIGDPGSGKSTLLEWLLLEWAAQPKSQPLPLFVELRQCARETADWKGDFCQYFSVAADPLFAFNAAQLDEHLRTNDSLLLVDGLDEVFDLNQRKQLTERILNFQNPYPRARIVVTSRKIGFQKDVWLNGGFRLFTLQDFDLPQVELFLDRWHDLVFPQEPAETQRLKPRLLASIREYAPIRELASNPLLLTMMAVINRMEPIPRDRRALYERCAELLAHRWEVDRGRIAGPSEQNTTGTGTLKSPLDLGDKKTLLEIIAHAMQNGPAGLAGNVIEEETLKQIVKVFLKDNDLAQEPGRTAREIIHQLRERNFILCFVGAARYAFVHRTFLEFFCASYFAQRYDGRAILQQVVRPHWRDERWHEVIRLMVAEKSKQPDAVKAIVHFLLEQNTTRERAVNVLLAADCVIDLRNPAELGQTRITLMKALEECFRFSLDFYHEPWGEEQEQENRIQSSAVSRWAALQMAMLSGRDAVYALAVNTEQWGQVRRTALQELARSWKDDPDLLPWLKDRALQDEYPDVRQAALQELARGWKDDPDLLSWLKDRALQDKDPDVRQAALQELARGWKDDPDLLPLLKDRALQDEDPFVRQAALQELARSWKDDPDLLPWLKDRALQDKNPDVRRAALRELARGWKDDPDVLELLKDHAESVKASRTKSQPPPNP